MPWPTTTEMVRATEMPWPDDDLHQRLLTVFRAILLNKRGADVGGFLARVQPQGIEGIDVERRESWNPEEPTLLGAVLGTWRFTLAEGITPRPVLSEAMETYNKISSPFPRFGYCVAGDALLAVTCVFGPRAGRGFTCVPIDLHGYATLALTDDNRWVS